MIIASGLMKTNRTAMAFELGILDMNVTWI